MKVFVDNQAVDDAFVTQDTTVEETVRHVQRELCPESLLVVGLRCDGEEIPPDQMAAALRQRARVFDRIEVSTGTRQALVADAMHQAATCLDDTEATRRRVAAMLTEGRTVEAAQGLGECLRVWQQIHEAVAKSIAILGLDPDEVMVQQDSLTDLIGRPKDVLLQIKAALQRQDYVLLADVLEYEFGDVAASWQSIVDVLGQRAASFGTDDDD